MAVVQFGLAPRDFWGLTFEEFRSAQRAYQSVERARLRAEIIGGHVAAVQSPMSKGRTRLDRLLSTFGADEKPEPKAGGNFFEQLAAHARARMKR